ncbi:hypothetical protein ACIA5D_05665 [Actinoplanes sp. NPDC051513]|uniref:hypothetical protein n=1 Tax=Actinoplanes sp. NPDC051513 TaxID=3363908 RepID=UPI00378FA612
MTRVEINRADIKRLGNKLMGLQHLLTPRERAILWSALGVAADALSEAESGHGQTTKVRSLGRNETAFVEVDGSLTAADLDADFPDMLARSFHPGRQPQDGQGQDGGGNQGKIGGLVGSVSLPSDQN